MPQTDFFEMEVEKLGRFLRVLISKMTGSEVKDESETKGYDEKTFKENFGIDLNDLKSMSESDFMELIASKPIFNSDNKELLADLLVSYADQNEKEFYSIKYLENALALYQQIDLEQRTFSIERMRKIGEVKGKLEI